MFITFEGLPASGKTTQLGLLGEKLQSIVPPPDLIITREPGGTRTGEIFRGLLLNNTLELDNKTQALLFTASRSEHVEKLIKPALAKGGVVLCDRFTDSTLAYQGFGHSRLSSAEIWDLSRVCSYAAGQLEPSITFYLDVPSKVALDRRGLISSNYRSEKKLEFYERVREGYLYLKNNNTSRFINIDATKSEERIHEIIFNATIERMKQSKILKNGKIIKNMAVKPIFSLYAIKLRHDTGHLSSVDDMKKHSLYSSIVDMGIHVVPSILEFINSDPSVIWISILHDITGANPIKEKNRGYVDRMCEDWQEWAKEERIGKLL